MALLIKNNDDNKHEFYINRYFQDAVHFDLLSAFASVGGVRFIRKELIRFLKVNSRNTARVIIGLNYEHTDPEVLDFFYELSQTHGGQL